MNARSILAAALLACSAAQAQTTIGLDTVSLHFPARNYNNVNPGLYVVTENGLTAGVFENSMRRAGAFVGMTLEQESGRFAITGGLVYGYQRRTVNCREAWIGGPVPAPKLGQVCDTQAGSPGALAPFLNPSVRLPVVLGLTPRITLIPPWFGGSLCVHLSLERTL